MAVGEALAPVQQAFRDIQRRLDDLERRPLVVGPAPVAPAPPVGAMRAPQATLAGGVTAMGSDLPGSIAPIPVTLASLAPRPPVLDVAAIERDASVNIDGAIDGRRRKLRLVLTFVLLLLVIFGGLFAALAYSYTPHTSGMAPTKNRGALVTLANVPVTQIGRNRREGEEEEALRFFEHSISFPSSPPCDLSPDASPLRSET
jgi:hypothetical protein